MKLYTTPNSPFVRKVLVTALETGSHDKFECISVSPWAGDTDVLRFNPVGKLPTLICDDGTVLYDSHVICHYLETLSGSDTAARLPGSAARLEALGDAMLEALVAWRMESRRPDGERSAGWIARQTKLVLRCIDHLETDADLYRPGLNIGQITIAIAIAHMEFRFPETDWRAAHPSLAAWFGQIDARPSFAATRPSE